MKKTKKLIAIVALAVMATGALFAQKSNTNGATAGIIKTDVDYSMDTRYYQEANVDNFLFYANVTDFLNLLDITEPSYFEVGFSKMFSNIYLSALYDGNLWGEKDTIRTALSAPATDLVYTEASCENNLGILVGFLNMGVRVDLHFAPSVLTYENPALEVDDTYPERVVHSEKKVPKKTDTSLRATWGASFDFTPFSLKPYVYIGDHYEAGEVKALVDVGGIFNQNVLEAGLGVDFAFDFTDKVSSIAGLKYDFGMGTKKIFDENKNVKEKKDIMNNFIDAYYSVNYKVNDRFEFGGKLDVANNLTAEKYILTPTLGFGAACDVIESTLGLNVGVDVALPDLLTSVQEAAWTFESTFYTGFEFKLGENAVIDMMMDIPIGATADGNIFNRIAIGASYRK